MSIRAQHLNSFFQQAFKEDGLEDNSAYIVNLPTKIVPCRLKIKSDLVLAGLPFFFEAFNFLLEEKISYQKFEELEGSQCSQGMMLDFSLPFNIALTGERIALNLLQRASSIATFTHQFALKAKEKNIAILDTRKTTPGLRWLEKYAVLKGGGHNHRFSQLQAFMIKDNHKNFFGGLKEAIDFFKSQKGFYTPLIVEIHSLDELKEAIAYKVQHVMLDNFSPEDVQKAVKLKENLTYEVSGGINLKTIDDYLIDGVDAISIGSLTYAAPPVDISLKYQEKN